MKITNIETFVVDAGWRPWTFVKVETSDPGLVGWGDCGVGIGSDRIEEKLAKYPARATYSYR